jgi:serine/threonine protein kinase
METHFPEKYTVQGLLGTSRLNKTYLAYDEHAVRYVIKELSLSAIDDWKMVELFQREASLLQSLNHPSIPEYVESGEDAENGSYFLIYKFIEGKSIRELIEAGEKFTPERCMEVMHKMLDILSYLHGQNPAIIHRDINPNNLIIDGKGSLFLVDLGAGKHVLKEEAFASGQTYVGTPGYIPLEQMAGNAEPASDIYGLGMTIVYMLSGKAPEKLPLLNMRPDYPAHLFPYAYRRAMDVMLDPDLKARQVGVPGIKAILDAGTGSAGSEYSHKYERSRSSGSSHSTIPSSSSLTISTRKGSNLLVFENANAIQDADGSVRSISSFLMDSPWIFFIMIFTPLSPIGIIMLILYFRFNLKKRAKKLLSKYAPVEISVDRGKLAVKGQMDKIPLKKIEDIITKRKKDGDLFNMEVKVFHKDGEKSQFFLSGLTEDELERTSEFLHKHIISEIDD